MEKYDNKGRKLPNNWQQDESMTEKDWDEYFECRKKYDRPMSEDECIRILNEITRLRHSQRHTEADDLTCLIPVSYKHAKGLFFLGGFKAIAKLNLYIAKQVAPDEF